MRVPRVTWISDADFWFLFIVVGGGWWLDMEKGDLGSCLGLVPMFCCGKWGRSLIIYQDDSIAKSYLELALGRGGGKAGWKITCK